GVREWVGGGGRGGGVGVVVEGGAGVGPGVSLVVGSLEHFSRRRRIRLLEQVILDNPAIGNQEELAALYLEEGRFARARELYDMVIAASRSESLDPFYRRGVAELGLQDYWSA